MSIENYHRHHRFMNRIGLGGISPDENSEAKLWASRLEIPMMILAVWIILDWYFMARGMSNAIFMAITDWFIWTAFTAELLTMLLLVNNKLRYLRHNWMNLFIIAAGLPILWGANIYVAGTLRILRLLIMLGILLKASRDIRLILARNHLGATLAIAFLFVLISGFLISGLDPAFHTALDGIWWAWVTMTTVGYGDLVPSTTEGRLLGMLLILFGIGLFSMMTASISVFFLSREEQDLVDSEAENISKMKRMEDRLDRIEHQLHIAVSTLERLESLQAQARQPNVQKSDSTPDSTQGK